MSQIIFLYPNLHSECWFLCLRRLPAATSGGSSSSPGARWPGCPSAWSAWRGGTGGQQLVTGRTMSLWLVTCHPRARGRHRAGPAPAARRRSHGGCPAPGSCRWRWGGSRAGARRGPGQQQSAGLLSSSSSIELQTKVRMGLLLVESIYYLRFHI